MTLSNDTKYIVIRVKVRLTGRKYHFEEGNLKILLERLQSDSCFELKFQGILQEILLRRCLQ